VPLLDIIDTAAGRLGGYLGVNTEPTQQRVERGLGQLIMQESGGLMADFRANPDCLLAKGVIYANPQLLKTLVKLISPMIS
jgi:fructose-1,6-bisphosphatase/inositol monophosphatase family enzyme